MRRDTLSTLLAALTLTIACGGGGTITDPPPPPPPPPPPAPVATVTVTPASGTLVPGQPFQLTAAALNAQGGAVAGAVVTWSSSASAVATVSTTGLVAAVGAGAAQITATSGSASAQATVTVEDGAYLGTGGGTFSLLGGAVRLTVPGGAVATPVAVRATAATGTPADPRILAATAVTLTPANTTFTLPVSLEVRYPVGLPADVVQTQLRLAQLVNNSWTPTAVAPHEDVAFIIAGSGKVDRTNRLVRGTIQATGTYAVVLPLPSLRGLAQARGLQIGAAVEPAGTPGNDPDYSRVLAAEFNSITPENVMKWGSIHPQVGTYSWNGAEQVMTFAEQEGMAVHGHVLAWHSQLPSYITGGTWTRTTLLNELRLHIETVVGRYRGRIASWDVANEVIADPGDGSADANGLRSTIFRTVIGPDYIDSAFVWARRADPDAKLYLNDYSVEHPVNNAVKISRLLALAQRLRNAGIPIDGIGLQAHLTLSAPSRAQFAQTMATFTDAGFDIRITELDVRIPDSDGSSSLTTQATIYGNLTGACIANPRCKAITTWGFTDKYSWIPGWFTGFGRALPFNQSYAPKPAHAAMMTELQPVP